jgi:hypothetical protein
MTLIEVMLAVSVIVIAALGTLCYEYLCVDHIRYARAQLTATRIGQLLLEDWKSTGGSDTYNPEYLQMGFNSTSSLPAGRCETVIDGLPFYIWYSKRDVSKDDFAGVTLREIDVLVRWNRDLGRGAVTIDDPSIHFTTYVRRDQ